MIYSIPIQRIAQERDKAPLQAKKDDSQSVLTFSTVF